MLFDLDDTLLDRRATVGRYLAGQCARFTSLPAVAQSYSSRFHQLDASGYADRATLFAGLAADVVLVSGEEGVAKPEAEIFHRATRRLEVRPHQVMFVGDNPRVDIEAARGAGLVPVWCRSGFVAISRGLRGFRRPRRRLPAWPNCAATVS